jgi:pyruvate dehydrogenase E1 component
LRSFFEVNAEFITFTALKTLFEEGKIQKSFVQSAIKKYGIDVKRANPLTL